MKKRIVKMVTVFLSYLPIKKNLIVFESFFGKQYSCHPKAIYEYLLVNKLDFQMIWSIDSKYKSFFETNSIPYVKRLSLKWFYLMARAKYWITNGRIPEWVYKRKENVFVQTWHGTPLKKLALDMKEVHLYGETSKRYKERFCSESSRWDFLISSNRYSTEIFKNAFRFKNKIIEQGSPRNDVLYLHNNSDNISALKQQYRLPNDKRMILYAPTWRDNQYRSDGQYLLDLQLDLAVMQEKLGERYIVLLRLHYLIANKLDLSKFKGFIYDFSQYHDINDFYLMADILITDYSSVLFDYANLKRPMIFYTYDLDLYRDKLRGFYFELEDEAPGPIVTTTHEVVSTVLIIEKAGFQAYAEKYEKFLKRFCYLDGSHSTEKVVGKIFNYM